MRVKVICSNCSVEFLKEKSSLKSSRSGLFFCKRRCKDEAQSIGGIKAIQPPHYKTGIYYYREKALKFLGARCKQCGYEEHCKMLDVDHIDGNRKNNKIQNLQVLCVWCHALKTRKI